MNSPLPTRLLSIGEFAAATQLSPKALRLYDEQDLIRPAVTDPANGYRYYRSAQVPTGRLIRTLREMNLPLAQIAQVVATQGPGAESLLQSLAQEIDRRYAAEKRAFQSALMLLRAPQRSATPTIEVIERGSVTACVRPFFADRSQLIERFVFEARAAREDAIARGATPLSDAFCSLVDPLSDEEGQLEVLLPVASLASVPQGLTVRHLPASTCAAVTTRSLQSHAAELTAALDALFDWFDRHGHSAVGMPVLAFESDANGPSTRIVWAFASHPVHRESP